jgi:microcystin-dependent protein
MNIEGIVVAFSGNVENSDFRDRLRHQGWLLCDGAAVERARYPRLFRLLGTTYGAGDGSTTFNLPDYRGLFLRGLSMGSDIDRGRALGQRQDCAVQAHKHRFGNNNANSPGTKTAVWFATNNPDPTFNTLETTETIGGAVETRPYNHAVNYLIRCDIELV